MMQRDKYKRLRLKKYRGYDDGGVVDLDQAPWEAQPQQDQGKPIELDQAPWDVRPAQDDMSQPSEMGGSMSDYQNAPQPQPGTSSAVGVAARSAGQAATGIAGDTISGGARTLTNISPGINQTAGGEGPPASVEDYTPAPAQRPEDNPALAPVVQAGKSVKQWGEDTFPITPKEREDHPIAATVGAGLGSVAPMVGLGLLDPPAALAATGAIFGLSGGEETYQEAKRHGADEQTATGAATIGGLASAALGTIPVGSVLKPLARDLQGPAVRILAEAGQSGIVFGSVGEAQTYIQAQIAKTYGDNTGYSFDPNRAAGNVIAGGILGGVHGVMEGRPDRTQPREEQQPQEQAQPQAANEDAPLYPPVNVGVGADVSRDRPAMDEPRREQPQTDEYGNTPPPDLPDRERTAPFLPSPEGEEANRNWYNRNIQPELVSDRAYQTRPLAGEFVSKQAQRLDAISHEAEDHLERWRDVPDQDRLDFLRDYEDGFAHNPDLYRKYPWMREEGGRYRQLTREAFAEEKRMGSQSGFFEEYFPHLWDRPQDAQNAMQNIRDTIGPRDFQKPRIFDTIEQGREAGFKLKTTNPEELMRQRLAAGARMVTKMEFMHSLRDVGEAVRSTDLSDAQQKQRLTWQRMSMPDGKEWMISPHAADLVHNSMDTGMWGKPGEVGNAYRKAMAVKNIAVSLKLSLSGFHAVHLAQIAVDQNMRRAANELGRGNLRQAGKEIFNNPWGTTRKAATAKELWTKRRSQMTPAERGLADIMHEAGFSPQMSEDLKLEARRGLAEAKADGSWKVAPYGMKRGLEWVNSWMMEHWIPSMKLTHFMRDVEQFQRNYPDAWNDPSQRRLKLFEIKENAERFGHMFYRSWFTNRTAQDLGKGGFLSLGWTAALLKLYGGGMVEAERSLMRAMPGGAKFAAGLEKLSPALRNTVVGRPMTEARRAALRGGSAKTQSVLTYMTVHALTSMAVQMGFTGTMPQDWKDWVWPRWGGNDKYGSPLRFGQPSFVRDVPMLMHDIQEAGGVIPGIGQWLGNKSMFGAVKEFVTGKDYWGNKTSDKNAGTLTQKGQELWHAIVNGIEPMSYNSMAQSLNQRGLPHEANDVGAALVHGDAGVWGALLGFTPAPAYSRDKSEAQKRVEEMSPKRQYSEPQAGSVEAERRDARNELKAARDSGDQQRIEAASKALKATGGREYSGGYDQYQFQTLSPSQKLDALRSADKVDFDRYWQKVGKPYREGFKEAPTPAQAKLADELHALWQKHHPGETGPWEK